MTLAIKLTDAQERELADLASRLNIPLEALAEAAVRDLLSSTQGDFEEVADRLLEKNRELYERLR